MNTAPRRLPMPVRVPPPRTPSRVGQVPSAPTRSVRVIRVNFLYLTGGSIATSRQQSDLDAMIAGVNQIFQQADVRIVRTSLVQQHAMPSGSRAERTGRLIIPTKKLRQTDDFAHLALSVARLVNSTSPQIRKQRRQGLSSGGASDLTAIFLNDVEERPFQHTTDTADNSDAVATPDYDLVMIDDSIARVPDPRVLAHEIMHWAGDLSHSSDPRNLMSRAASGTQLNPRQIALLRNSGHDVTGSGSGNSPGAGTSAPPNANIPHRMEPDEPLTFSLPPSQDWQSIEARISQQFPGYYRSSSSGNGLNRAGAARSFNLHPRSLSGDQTYLSVVYYQNADGARRLVVEIMVDQHVENPLSRDEISGAFSSILEE